MSQKEIVFADIRKQGNGSTRCESFLRLKERGICWQSVAGRIADLEKEGRIVFTGNRRNSVWNKPNNIYMVVS